MKDIKDCVVESLDGSNNELLPYLPYILQDIIEIGTDPEIVCEMIRKVFPDPSKIRLLDLGCGKGAVTVRVAKDMGCFVLGVDALSQFLESARQYANDMGVESNCKLINADIRLTYKEYKDFDVVVLGAIGDVLGNVQVTLEKVSDCLKPHGYVILDDGYIPNESSFTHPKCSNKTIFYQQIEDAGFRVLSEAIIQKKDIEGQNEIIFNPLKQRCKELIALYPEKSHLFTSYIEEQDKENYVLENELVCGIWLLQKKQEA